MSKKLIKEFEWEYPGYIVRQQLIDTRGWPPELIDLFLSPNLVETNPHNHAQQMRLYLLDVVFTVEQSEKFKKAALEFIGKSFDPKVQAIAFFHQKKENLQRTRNHYSAMVRIKTKKTNESALQGGTIKQIDKLKEMGML